VQIPPENITTATPPVDVSTPEVVPSLLNTLFKKEIDMSENSASDTPTAQVPVTVNDRPADQAAPGAAPAVAEEIAPEVPPAPAVPVPADAPEVPTAPTPSTTQPPSLGYVCHFSGNGPPKCQPAKADIVAFFDGRAKRPRRDR